MKKILIFCLVVCMLIALCGCGKKTGNSQSASESNSSTTQNSENSQSSNAPSSSVGQNSSTQSAPNSNTQASGSAQNSTGNTSIPNVDNGEIVTQGQVKILSSYGGMETAFVTWEDSSFEGYAVYSKSNGENYKKVDNSLIRRYSAYWRADVLGLSAGEVQIKVVPVNGGSEDDGASSAVKVNVINHKREGFAFSQSSPNKTSSGAYNEDGTLKSGARVLYVTKDNINTVSLDIIKNSKNQKETRTGLLEIMKLREKGYDKTPLAVRIIGKISESDIVWATANVKEDSNRYLNIKGCYNVTIEGVGSDATCHGWSMKVRDANNVEIRNLGFMLFVDDGVTIDTDNNNIWVHNNDFFYGGVGSDADQAKGDGSCDNKKSNYLTISYNHFWDSGKAILCGMKDEPSDIMTTFHHNWFDHSDSRHPRIRIGSTHVYNNFYDGVSKYGIGATMGCSAFAESNYFLNTKKPILASLQGTDAMGEGTFSGEAGGIVKAFGNIYDKTAKPIDWSQNNTSFDCYTVANRNDQIPQTVKTLSGATTYNNFDTASTMYAYTPDKAENVPQIVRTFSGRVGGGDFTWKFSDSDNSSYAVNTALKNAIINYNSSLVSVGGTK